MTLQQIKDSLPKYCCLTSPDIAKEGDVVAVTIKEKGSRGGEIAYEECEVVIRPIPDEVLDNQAFWILLHRLSPMPVYWSKGGEPYAMYTHHNWLEPEQVEALGGEANCKKQTEAGDLYPAWLGEQIG